MKNNLVLIVEDEPKLADLLLDYMTQSGFRAHIIANGDEAEPWVRENRPDMVLLDLMLPGKDGLTLCRELRTFTSVPIIMITARIEEIDRLLGLEIGADDYICKPFSPREVVARVKAIFRRANLNDNNAAAGDALCIDEDRYRITIYNRDLDLTPVEFRLVQCLARKPGKVMSREQLLNVIYTDYRVVTDRTVDSHIKNIRRKMKEAVPDQEIIRSIYGVGYSLELT